MVSGVCSMQLGEDARSAFETRKCDRGGRERGELDSSAQLLVERLTAAAALGALQILTALVFPGTARRGPASAAVDRTIDSGRAARNG